MADLQKYFSQFHDAIALKRDAEIAILADKRRKVLDKLGTGIERQRKAGAIIPTYRPLNQGSYPMGTGIKPVKGDYYDAIFIKGNTCIPFIVECTGGITPHFLWHLRRLARKAKGARDGTKYGSSRRSTRSY